MLRLQCPRCQTVVKIDADTIVQHPVVRCAQCQGLIPAIQCIIQERPAPPKTPRRFKSVHRRQVDSPLPMIFGIMAVVVVLFGAGIGIFFLVNHLSNSNNSTASTGKHDSYRLVSPNRITPPGAQVQNQNLNSLGIEQLADRSVDILENMLGILERIHTVQDVEKLGPSIISLGREAVQLEQQIRTASQTIPRDQVMANSQAILARMTSRIMAMKGRFEVVKARFDANPQIIVALQKLGLDSLPGAAPGFASGFRPPAQPPTEPIFPNNNKNNNHQNNNNNDSRSNRPQWTPPENKFKSMPLRQLVDELKSSRNFEKTEVIRTLQTINVTEEATPDMMEAVVFLLEDSDVHFKSDVLKLAKKWAKSQADKDKIGEQAEVLLKDHSTRADAIRWFGENKVISASKEVARCLKENNFEKSGAAEALIAMGSGAEPSVIPYLSALEPTTRHLAIEVLARIGTKECLPALRKLQTDPQVGLAAKQTIRIINNRYPDK